VEHPRRQLHGRPDGCSSLSGDRRARGRAFWRPPGLRSFEPRVLLAASSYGVALIGLLGAVVGGFITAGSNLLIDWKRRRDEHEDERERAQRELRRAVRIVLAELEEIDYAIRDVVRAGIWGPAEKQLPAIAWAEHHVTLADDLEPPVWSSVHSAYRELNDLNWTLRWREQLRQVRTPDLTDQERARFRQPWLAVRGAQQALGPLEVPKEKVAGRVAAHQQVTAKVDRDLWPRFHMSEPTETLEPPSP
jgi:hypothetical protein